MKHYLILSVVLLCGALPINFAHTLPHRNDVGGKYTTIAKPTVLAPLVKLDSQYLKIEQQMRLPHKHDNCNGVVGRGFKAKEFDDYVRSIKFGAWKPHIIVLHNTYIPTLTRWHKLPGERWMDGLCRYYQRKGWRGGPHLFIDDQKIWVLTPLTRPGVHTPSWNGASWGVEVVGDYRKEPFTKNLTRNTVSALATLHEVGGIDSHTLKLHKDDPLTTHKGCPGKNISKKQITQLVHELILTRQSQRGRSRSAQE